MSRQSPDGFIARGLFVGLFLPYGYVATFAVALALGSVRWQVVPGLIVMVLFDDGNAEPRSPRPVKPRIAWGIQRTLQAVSALDRYGAPGIPSSPSRTNT